MSSPRGVVDHGFPNVTMPIEIGVSLSSKHSGKRAFGLSNETKFQKHTDAARIAVQCATVPLSTERCQSAPLPVPP
jgi:hypothetical protein